MKQQFRLATLRGTRAVEEALSNARLSCRPSEFPKCVLALKSFAPKQAPHFFAFGPREFRSLVWGRIPLEKLPLAQELQWAPCWLAGQHQKINAFRSFALSVQELILDGKLDIAANALDAFNTAHGWSIWCVDLRCALEQLLNGTKSQERWAATLRATAPRSIAGLVLNLSSDRNSSTLSYDAFYAKCRDSFPRLNSIARWLPRYLLYRTLGRYDQLEDTFSNALARDITSSLIDYYETLIDALKTIMDQSHDAELQAAALHTISRLRASGFVDHRIAKLSSLFAPNAGDREAMGETLEQGKATKLLAVAQSQLYESIDWELAEPSLSAAAHIRACRVEGSAAATSQGALLKLGANLRGLDIGPALASIATASESNLIEEPIGHVDMALVSAQIIPDDIAVLSDVYSTSALRAIQAVHATSAARERASDMCAVFDGRPVTWLKDEASPLHLWLGRQLLNSRRFDDLEVLCQHLSKKGPYWSRQGAKFELWSLIRRNLTSDALNFAASWILSDARFIVEFPVAAIFSRSDWSDLRSISAPLVALVAHHLYATFGDTNVGFVCKMACRQFAISGGRAELQARYDSMANEFDRKVFLAFLRGVWIEVNLSMNHLLESTDEVRKDRMEVLQVLLPRDKENEALYVEEIKILTFDETVRRGLRHINQTRVFVNEAAITRWAEKELPQDFERWTTSVDSGLDTRLADDILRQLAIDPRNQALLDELGGGTPTQADTLLVAVFERLFQRFLTDPTDGLDCFLSLRIRHGSLRGTLLGPLEEAGLLYADGATSRHSFENRWAQALPIDPEARTKALDCIMHFTTKLRFVVDELVNERVQIASTEKSKGAIRSRPTPAHIRLLSMALSGQPKSFQLFVFACYTLFWKIIEVGLAELVTHIRDQVREQIQGAFDETIEALRNLGDRPRPLVTTLMAVATTTRGKCDVVAEWFRSPVLSEDSRFPLSAAVEIARSATSNVYRTFPATVSVSGLAENDPRLSTSALAVLSDCLFVIFENAWKHSGLGPALGPIQVNLSFDPNAKLLTVEVRNSLANQVRQRLASGELEALRSKYLSAASPLLASREGGSGLAKLARLSRHVPPREGMPSLDFGLIAVDWYTKVTVPLFERDGAYEALQ